MFILRIRRKKLEINDTEIIGTISMKSFSPDPNPCSLARRVNGRYNYLAVLSIYVSLRYY